MDFTGKRVLVTGAGSGIGAATARRFGAAGASVVVHYRRSRDEAEAIVREIRDKGGRALALQADVSSEPEVERLVEQSLAFLGGLDVLVNNAGTLVRRAPLMEMTPELWDTTLRVNLTSVFYVTQRCAPHLTRPGGRIVNVTSIAAHNGGGPGSLAYAAAKGGVVSLTRALAKELGKEGITVNAVSPGVIMTRFHEEFSTPERLMGIAREIPLGRLGSADECASAILFLASPEASYINGEVLEINGGQYFV